jgi:hypothetical protein
MPSAEQWAALSREQLALRVLDVLAARHRNRYLHLSDRQLYRLLADRLRRSGPLPPVPDWRRYQPQTPVVACGCCGARYALTRSGAVRRHRGCPGGGHPPAA